MKKSDMTRVNGSVHSGAMISLPGWNDEDVGEITQ